VSSGKNREDKMRTFDEMYLSLPAEGGAVRDHYRDYAQWLGKQSQEYLRARSAEAEIVFRRVGITFAVYGDKDESGAGTERLIPFDLIPASFRPMSGPACRPVWPSA
jgi:uncharacterized circularly permuted ATP-grasp superfamily protein